MTYAAGQTILDDDYNIFATGNAAGTGNNGTVNVNTLWGTGTGTYGYGQTSTVSPVSAGSTITATQWATLLSRITSLANHQGSTISAITTPTVGATINAEAQLQNNLNTVWNNRENATANGTDSSANTTTTGTWDVRAVTTKTITFAGANQMRYFFNAGGHIRMSFSLTGTSGDAKSLEWADTLTKCGTIVVTGSGNNKTIAAVTYAGTTKIGGGYFPDTLASSTGALDYTGTAVTIFKQFSDTYTYSTNFVRINASIASNVITFAVTLEDAAFDFIPNSGAGGTPDPGGSIAALDVVDGTLTMTTTIRPPNTTYISTTWGSVTQNAASWTLTS